MRRLDTCRASLTTRPPPTSPTRPRAQRERCGPNEIRPVSPIEPARVGTRSSVASSASTDSPHDLVGWLVGADGPRVTNRVDAASRKGLWGPGPRGRGASHRGPVEKCESSRSGAVVGTSPSLIARPKGETPQVGIPGWAASISRIASSGPMERYGQWTSRYGVAGQHVGAAERTCRRPGAHSALPGPKQPNHGLRPVDHLLGHRRTGTVRRSCWSSVRSSTAYPFSRHRRRHQGQAPRPRSDWLLRPSSCVGAGCRARRPRMA
jgi:hypothetical protein